MRTLIAMFAAIASACSVSPDASVVPGHYETNVGTVEQATSLLLGSTEHVVDPQLAAELDYHAGKCAAAEGEDYCNRLLELSGQICGEQPRTCVARALICDEDEPELACARIAAERLRTDTTSWAVLVDAVSSDATSAATIGAVSALALIPYVAVHVPVLDDVGTGDEVEEARYHRKQCAQTGAVRSCARAVQVSANLCVQHDSTPHCRFAARMAEVGLGVPADSAQARTLLEHACSLGDEGACAAEVAEGMGCLIGIVSADGAGCEPSDAQVELRGLVLEEAEEPKASGTTSSPTSSGTRKRRGRKRCVTGKPCGNSCIAKWKRCHK